MTVAEASVTFAIFLVVLHRYLGNGSVTVSAILFVIIAVIVAVQLASSHFRWQMIPAWLVALSILIMAIFEIHPVGLTKVIGLSVAMICLLLTVALATGLPVRTLPAPDGPWGVGTISTRLERPISGGQGNSLNPVRTLAIKVWYPSDKKTDQKKYTRDTLWSEFYNTNAFPAVVRLLSSYLKNVKTHSLENAPLRTTVPCPLILYHHGVISIAGENTLLMEHLASNGYIVAGVRHVEQSAEYADIQKNITEEEKARDQALFEKLAGKLTRQERSQISLQLYQQSTGMPTIVRRRSADASFVLDNIDAVLTKIPGYTNEGVVSIAGVAALGLSLGGAVATQFCKSDNRCLAAANMDGGIYGDHILDPVKVPYLMLYSEHNLGGNDFLKTSSLAAFEEHWVAGANHANFHDASIVLPVLRWFGVLGKVSGAEVNRQKNNYINSFFDKVFR